MASTVELTRLRSPGEVLVLEERHWTGIPGHKSDAARMGLAIDAAEKERAAEAGAVISDTYAPHDFHLGFYYDIKSTEGRWLSLQHSEYDLAEREILAGRDVFYAVYEQLDGDRYSFIGYTAYSRIRFAVRFGRSPFCPMDVVRKNLL